MTISLVYIHIGNNIPDYLYDTIYQTLLINNYSCKIYILIEDSQIENVTKNINNFNLNNYFTTPFYFENIIQFIPLSILNDELFEHDVFKQYKRIVTTKFGNMSEFRDGFWISTTARFFYIYIFMKIFNVNNVFHIENDVMIYKKFQFLQEYILEYIQINDNTINRINKICMIQDSVNRVIPSLLYFPDINSLYNLIVHITTTLEQSLFFINDMNLLGTFSDKYLLQIDPTKACKNETVIFDGAAIGQFLGGIDTKNLNNENNELILINNPTKGFINETSEFKPNTCNYIKNPVYIENLKIQPRVFSCKDKLKNKLYSIANLHIHSKQLHEFSSVFDITYNDIITGDRIIGLCDFVILTNEIYNFHKNLDKYAKDIILIKDFNDVNFKLLNIYLKDKSKKKSSKHINLFLYTHILDLFIKHIFPYLDKSLRYNFYIHNSDHDFNDNHLNLLNHDSVNKIYTQNINTSKIHDKLLLLPLGLANSMWSHGNIVTLYKTMKKTYKYKKEKNIYININPNTFNYRREILNNIKKSNFEISENKSFEQYLNELAKNRFCLCIRGNGIDTHRFWESLYLNVIPVIINNKYTKCNTFVEYLKKNNIPFYEIKSDDLLFDKKYNNDFFNETLYQTYLKQFDNNYLKLSSYTF